ncbi:MAG: lipid IV(A) 3-deoxy-D-manno-octulosonic acid transferase [Steroidobacter sp.]
MLRLLYTLALYLAAPVALAFTALRGLKNPAYRDRLGERLGFTRARFGSPPIWVHAVSVGEVQAAAALVRELFKRYPQHPLLVTTATPTGAQRIAALFGKAVTHAYLPYDTPGAVRRFLGRTRPRVAIVMEREIWPNLFSACARRDIPLVLASARISAASAQRHRRLAGLFGPALASNVTIAAQTEADAERYRSIGADAAATHVTGNIKFDLDVPDDVRRQGEALRKMLSQRPVWTAGSTHEGEEALVLDAHQHVCAVHGDALLILVPRHPNRFASVAAWLKSRDVRFVARSSNERMTAATSVLLADTLGELLMLYAAADIAFVGGSLVPIGGHNLLEPAALSRPIVVGPHNFNAQEIAQMFLESGAAIEVKSAAQLAQALLELFANEARRGEIGARGRALLESNRGALERVMRLIESLGRL